MFSHDTSAIVFVNLGCINENGVKITFWENSLAYMHLMYKSPKKTTTFFGQFILCVVFVIGVKKVDYCLPRASINEVIYILLNISSFGDLLWSDIG